MVLILEIIGTLSLALLIWKLFTEYSYGGTGAGLAWMTHFISTLPGVDGLLSSFVRREVAGLVGNLYKEDGIGRSVQVTIPEKGMSG